MINKIHIVSAADDNYAQHLGVMITSLLDVSKNPKKVNLHIIDGGISSTNKEKIKQIVKSYRAEIKFEEIDNSVFLGLKLSKHISLASYYRIVIPRIFMDYKKIIYLDSDMIIKKDIETLWRTDLKDKLLAAVEDPLFNRHDELSIPKSYNYFNSGVMLINNYLWIKEDVETKVLEFLRYNDEVIEYWDQDGLNGILYDKWIPLPPCWNQQRIFFEIDYKKTIYSESEFIKAINDPSIIHFTTSMKPWYYADMHPRQQEYYRYLLKTPWRGYRPNDKNIKNMIKKGIKKILWH